MAERTAGMDSIVEPTAAEVARGRPATQSSISAYSRGTSVETDAAGAVGGRADGTIGCHTALEDGPWWRVDLDGAFRISRIVLVGRYGTTELARRMLPLEIALSADGSSFVTVHRHTEPFGDGTTGALVWEPAAGAPEVVDAARHVRLRVGGVGILHLDRVEVFGVPAAPTAIPPWTDAIGEEPTDPGSPAREPTSHALQSPVLEAAPALQDHRLGESWPAPPPDPLEPPPPPDHSTGDAPADPEESFVARMRRAMFGG